MYVTKNIEEIEDRIIQLENNIEFNLNSHEIISEGFIHTIYHFIVKVFNFIKNGLYRIWKFIIKIIKAFIQKAKQILGKISDSEKSKNKEYKADFSFSENKHTKTYSNFSSLQNDYIKAINDITKTMEYHYKQNIENVTRSEKELLKKAKSNQYVYESVTYDDELAEIPELGIKTQPNTVFQGKSYIDMLNMENIMTTDIDLLTLIANTKENTVKLYNELTKGSAERCANIVFSREYNSLNHQIDVINNKLNENNDKVLPGHEIKLIVKNQAIELLRLIVEPIINNDETEYLSGNFDFNIYPQFPDTDRGKRALIAWAKSKVYWNKCLIEQLNNILIACHAEFGISLQQAKEDFPNMSNQEKIYLARQIIANDIDKFLDLSKNLIDFRRFGMGCFIFSTQFNSDQYRNQLFKYLDTRYSDILLSTTSKFDISVFGHGIPREYGLLTLLRISYTTSSDSFNIARLLYNDQINIYSKILEDENKNIFDIIINGSFTLNDEEKIFDKAMMRFKNNNKLFRRYALDYGKSKRSDLKNSKIIVTKPKFLFKQWEISGFLFTPGGKGPFNNIELLVYALMDEGFKRINLISCNENRMVLNQDLFRRKNVQIKSSTMRTLL